MDEISPEEAEGRLKQPIIVLTPRNNTFAVRFDVGADTLEHALEPGRARLEIVGPYGRDKKRFVWLANFDDGRVLPDPSNEPPKDLTDDAQAAVDAWYAWEEARS